MIQKKQRQQSKLYRQWKNMRYCCDKPSNNMYHNHGALGITYSKEWASFSVFEKWALSNGYQDGCSLCRKNPHKNFSPDNCEWQLKFSRHGMSNSHLYLSWRNMFARCYNQTHKSYKDYGGRGILITSEWNEFIPFKEWAIQNGYKDGLTIDRIDVNGNYEPSNCRWTNRKTQCNNRRSNHFLTFNGKTQTISQWARELNITPAAISNRVKKGLPINEILRTKKHAYRGKNHFQNLISFNGTTLNQKQWAEKIGISQASLGKRLQTMTIEQALTTPKRR